MTEPKEWETESQTLGMRKEGGVCFRGVHMGMMGKDESDHTCPLFH